MPVPKPWLEGQTPPSTINPVEAAQEIRVLVTQMVQGTPEYDEDEDEERDDDVDTVLSSLDWYVTRLFDKRTHINNFTKQIEEILTRLEEAITNRRASPGLHAMQELRINLNRVKGQNESQGNDLNELRDRLRDLREQTAGQQPSSTLDRSRLERLYKLAQCLPTTADIPMTTADNTLRAICALLRHHRWPGSEELTQVVEQREEVQDGKELDEVLVEAAATEVAVAGVGGVSTTEFVF